MENQITSKCNCCYTSFSPDDIFCNGCGYPLQGTKHQQATFISDRQIREIDLEESNNKIRSATNSLYWIGGMLAFWGIIYFAMNQDNESAFATFIINSILSLLFFGLGVWSKTKPAPALISGLSLFVIIQILSAIVSPISIISGIIFKAFIIIYLIKGIKAVLDADKLKKELNID